VLKLSVLDQSIATAGRPHAAAIQDTLAMARHCEALGYHRFWVSEHHNHASIVGTAPEILMAAIATQTSRIRIGSAGVMLPHYSALHVAEQFRLLDALAPGRIDLGVGRAPGSDGRTAYALNPNAATAAEQFPTQIRDLSAWVSGTDLPEGHPFRQVRAFPAGETSPQIWVLGSSDYGAQVAAHFGLPYCFAHFITDGRGAEQAIKIYRETFRPSAQLTAPLAALCCWALAADTESEAQRLFTSRARWKLGRERGLFLPIEAPEAAAAHATSAAEAARIAELRATAMVGTAAQVGAHLRELSARLGIDEIAVLTWTYDPQARRRSYSLLAEDFALAGSPA